MQFEYKTHILCIEDYPSPNNPTHFDKYKTKIKKFEKGKTYHVGVRKHPLIGLCYYELQEDGESVTGYFIEKNKRLFKEINNSIHFIINEKEVT